MKHLLKFDKHEEYHAEEVSGLVKPNVSFCVKEKHTHYKKYRRPKVLKFVAEQAGSTVKLEKISYEGPPPNISLQYSTDEGVSWGEFPIGTAVTIPTVGGSIMLKGVNNRFTDQLQSYHHFVMTGRIAAEGDITSLLNGIGGDYPLKSYEFCRAFSNCAALTTPPDLPSVKVDYYTYASMFSYCTSLSKPPELGARLISEGGEFAHMFIRCTALTKSPDIMVETLENRTLEEMFSGCTNLSYIKVMNVEPFSYSAKGWVKGVSPTGTFVMNKDAEWDPEEYRGVNGVPQGWTVVTEEI